MNIFSLSSKEIEHFNKNYLNEYADDINFAFTLYKDGLERVVDKLRQRDLRFCFQEKQYSLDDMLKICFDFYKSLDKNLYNKIIDLLRNENVDVIITEPSPKNKDKNSFCGEENDRQKVVINPPNDNLGLLIVCHEFCHILSQRMQENAPALDSTIGEVEALFIEKVFVNYLFEKGIFTEEEKDNFSAYKDWSLINKIYYCFQRNDILTMLGFYPLDRKNLKDLIKSIKRSPNKNILFDRLKEMATENYRYEERYVLGEIVATVLFDHYLKDKKGTIKKFEEYLTHNAQIDREQMLKELLGCNLNDMYKQYMEIKTREIEAEADKAQVKS